MRLVEEDVVKKLDNLPTSSPAVTKLISIIDNPTTTRDDVLHLLALDQVLFANAFKYANSAALGACRKLESLTEIVDVLGFNVLKSIAVLTALHNVSNNKELWFNGIFIAIAAKKIALKLNKDANFCDDIFMATMMQQYGLFAIIHFYPDQYQEIDTNLDFYQKLEQETTRFGYNHLNLAAKVLETWGLPKKVISIITNQESKKNEILEPYNLIIDLARTILEAGRLETEDKFDCFVETNKALLKDLAFDLKLDYIEEIFAETRSLMSI